MYCLMAHRGGPHYSTTPGSGVYCLMAHRGGPHYSTTPGSGVYCLTAHVRNMPLTGAVLDIRGEPHYWTTPGSGLYFLTAHAIICCGTLSTDPTCCRYVHCISIINFD